MKCPYQTRVIHKTGDWLQNAEDITMFADCLKHECPFYHVTEYKPARQITEHCRRAEKETEK